MRIRRGPLFFCITRLLDSITPELYIVIKHKRDMTTTERKRELNDKIHKVFYQMGTKAWDEIFDYERENDLRATISAPVEPTTQDFLDQIEQDGLKDVFESVIMIRYSNGVDRLHTDYVRNADNVDPKRSTIRDYYVYTTSEVNETLCANCDDMLEDSGGIHLILVVDSYYPDYDQSFQGTYLQVLEDIASFYKSHSPISDPIVILNHWGYPYRCEIEQESC